MKDEPVKGAAQKSKHQPEEESERARRPFKDRLWEFMLNGRTGNQSTVLDPHFIRLFGKGITLVNCSEKE